MTKKAQKQKKRLIILSALTAVLLTAVIAFAVFEYSKNQTVTDTEIHYDLSSKTSSATETLAVVDDEPAESVIEAEKDTVPPKISGVSDVKLTVGDTFNPSKNVTVTDDTDKNPQLKIDDSKLNLKKAGTYTVGYTATDFSGNKTVANRKITVAEKVVPKPDPKPVVNKYTPPGGTYGWDATGIKNQPYLVAVNRAKCTVTVYGKDNSGNYTVPVKTMACSVGRSGHSTPTGRYNTLERYSGWHRMVDNSYGRYAIRIKGQIMFHSVCYLKVSGKYELEYEEYNKLGSPASLGCIRLCLRDIKWLYDNCPKGFPVIIYDDNKLSGPLGKPDSIKIDVNDTEKRIWDPTDWDKANPWNKVTQDEETENPSEYAECT